MANKIGPGAVHDVLKKHILADGLPLVLDLQKSKDSTLVDAKTGKEYLDFFGFFGSLPVGFNRHDLWDKEWRERIAKCSLIKPSLSDVYTEEQAQFVSTFVNAACPQAYKHYFFIDGGALAVENALKAAFDWKVRKNLAKGIKNKGSKIIHFKQAFHGRSGYTLSLTNTFDPRKTIYFPKFDWPRVLNPGIRFPKTVENIRKTERDEAKSLKEIEKIIEKEAVDIAAIIIEPIQCEGGDIHFRKEYLQALRKICDEQQILLIFDEIQTGLGTTGKWWACQHFDLEPDIIAFGKKTQICGIMATSRLDQIDSVFKVPSRINSTFGGNLVDMVRSTAYLEYIVQHKLVENAASLGEYILEELEKIAAQQPPLQAIRGRGLLIAFDLDSTELRDQFIEEAFKEGLLLLKCGEKTVRMRPALSLSKKEVDQALTIIAKVRKKLYLPKS